ncbi:MAG: DUF5916 domain-containing protein [Bacteroidales bacterium]|nr:DUF5916 domain-containing protein [Bacteroidales bacterium]
MRYILVAFVLLLHFSTESVLSQQTIDKKQGQAKKIEIAPRIDGLMDDLCWMESEIFTDFRQYEPFSGEVSRLKTEVRIVYNDEAIFVCAINYDSSPDSIRTELGPRDGDRNIIADYFNIDIVPYNDGINGYSFKLAASGVQSDIRRSSGAGGRDLNWDAVWQSAARITDNGWIAEFKIPFSAIRFPADSKDAWGINFWRYIQRYGEWSSWNYADKSYGTTINYMGEVKGINGLKPPARISLSPYMSGHIERNGESGEWSRTFHGGADLKVGLSESFTLDATLIPDFKQVRSDDQVLNLSPYEVKYNERRQFFTEGTDVFNKGGIFYSRRVASKPGGYSDAYSSLLENEILSNNPEVTRLINATKVSGRTVKGLGIGVFNGITASSEAVIEDTLSGSSRNYVTQPMANYNMLVLDQNLGGGSYISLANTNVMRKGNNSDRNYTANVTAGDFKYLSKDRTYSLSGIMAVSQKYFSDQDDIFGHSVSLRGGKTGGTFTAAYSFSLINGKYDPNDMGYLRRNNELNNTLSLGYNKIKPHGIILYSLNSMSFRHKMLHTPRSFSAFGFDIESKTTFRNQWIIDLEVDYNPVESRDFYEPRVGGRYFVLPASAAIEADLTTDNRKILSLSISGEYESYFSKYDMSRYSLAISPTLRINNKYIINHTLGFSIFKSDFGYAGIINDSIIFGQRNSSTIENILSFSYIHSAKSYLNLRIRHYWSQAEYLNYYHLEQNGSLNETSYDLTRDINTNFFNIDMVYSWRFAPGSELKLVWKNSLYQSANEIIRSFGKNLETLAHSPAINNFSIKVLYYLDYHTITSSVK